MLLLVQLDDINFTHRFLFIVDTRGSTASSRSGPSVVLLTMVGKLEVDIDMHSTLHLYRLNPFLICSLRFSSFFTHCDGRAEPKAPFVKTVNQGVKSGVWQRKYRAFIYLF